VALVRALSLHGCFVKTELPFRVGARVALKITHTEYEFSVTGCVVVRSPDRANRGIGVEFSEIEPIDRARLESYLADLAREEKSALFAALMKKPRMRTASGHTGESDAKPGRAAYPWQQAVIDAFQSSRDSIPVKVSVAERAIADRLSDPNQADLEELLALKDALHSLHLLIAETKPKSPTAQGKKDTA